MVFKGINLPTLEQLIVKLKSAGVLRTPRIIEAFKKVDRADFIRDEYKNSVYEDIPLSIGYGQTISQPTTVAFMLERLNPKEGNKVLDLGSGSAWTTALLAYIVGPTGQVFGIERVDELVKFGEVNLNKYGYDYARIIKSEDVLGYPKEAPYDRILVSAASQELPQSLVDQLKEGAVMVIPVKSSLYKVTKTKDAFETEEYYGFSFVPLIE